MSSERDKDFDGFLRQNLRNSTDYIADDGFSRTLCGQLPQKSSVSWLPWVALTAISIIIASLIPWMGVVNTVRQAVMTLDLVALLKVASVSAMVSVVAVAGWFAKDLKWL